jgi:peptidoglycan L-alanyl-D-glutamate endopeptidase CwlK
MNDAISNQRLALVHPLLLAKVNAAANLLAGEAIYFRVAQGLRTFAESDADYALGRTVLTKADGSPQGKVTNARGGYSWHNFGLAVDCYPFVHGVSGDLDWLAESPEFKTMARVLMEQGLVWGELWHTIKDGPHFQLSQVPVSPTNADRDAYDAGGMAAVWKRYA